MAREARRLLNALERVVDGDATKRRVTVRDVDLTKLFCDEVVASWGGAQAFQRSWESRVAFLQVAGTGLDLLSEDCDTASARVWLGLQRPDGSVAGILHSVSGWWGHPESEVRADATQQPPPGDPLLLEVPLLLERRSGRHLCIMTDVLRQVDERTGGLEALARHDAAAREAQRRRILGL